MKVFISATEEQEIEIRKKKVPETVDIHFDCNMPNLTTCREMDAFFILNKEAVGIDYAMFGDKPVIINAVVETLLQMKLPANVSRINGWSGFLQRDIWEIASSEPGVQDACFKKLEWNIIRVKDEPGLVAARVICMIINEAYFAFNEKVSTKKEIDMAMKKGTNYPFGPFEWAEKIGIENVFQLLKIISGNDGRYLPSFLPESR